MNPHALIDHMLLLSRSYDQYCKCLQAEYNLRASDLSVLTFLAAHPECHTAQDICERRLIAKSLVSGSVDLLVSRGLISREVDPTDRRRALLSMQPAAEEIVNRAGQVSESYLRHICDGIPAEDLQTMERVLAQISHNMNAMDATN